MIPVLVEVSSVVVAKAHNPSILNHDWLIGNGVLPDVPEGWELAEPPFATPPLSRIQYQNNLRIVLDSDRLVVTIQQLGHNTFTGRERIVMDIARQYVKVLKHLPYVASGNNFKAAIECEDAEQKLISVFGGNGRWIEDLGALSAKLRYRLDGGCLRNVEIATRKGEKFEDNESKMIDTLFFSGNYHRETPSTDSTLKAISEASSDLRDFLTFVTEFGEDICG